MKRLRAELWDKMHYLFRDRNDRMIHIEIDYDYPIDKDAFCAVLRCFIEANPVFHSSFTDNRILPYWKVKPYRIDDIVHEENVTDEELPAKADAFLCGYIPPESDLQIQIMLFRHGERFEKTDVCILLNHMCMDGGDSKYFTNTLARGYTDYVEHGVLPVFRTGSRNYRMIYKDFDPQARKVARSLYHDVNHSDDRNFPWTPDSPEDRTFIARRKVSAEKFLALKAEGKKHGYTINDMLTAAFFYTLYELGVFAPNDKGMVSSAIDLRRHMKTMDGVGMTNHTAWMQCTIPERGADIWQTLDYVAASYAEYKADPYMGLHALPLLSFGFTAFPQFLSEFAVGLGYSQPPIAMSNIGFMDVKALALCGHEPVDGMMTGAVKYKPATLLALTTMRNEITYTVCERGNAKDRELVEKFYDMLEHNMDVLIAGKDA